MGRKGEVCQYTVHIKIIYLKYERMCNKATARLCCICSLFLLSPRVEQIELVIFVKRVGAWVSPKFSMSSGS